MRGFGGFSFPIARGVRAGLGLRGFWLGARTSGPAGTYAGVRASSSSMRVRSGTLRANEKPVVLFEVDDAGRVFVGDSELKLEQLEAVVELAKQRRR